MVKLEDYIKKSLKAGYSKTTILQQLLRGGYNEKEVLPMIDAVQEQLYPKDTVKKWQWGAGVGGVIAVIAVVLSFLGGNETMCSDTSCFTAAANACQPAQYYKDIEGTKMLYEIKGCVLIKRFIEFGSKEPKKLQDVLAGKDIECPYNEGLFDTELLDVFGGLNQCRGTLKDAVYELRVVQESIE